MSERERERVRERERARALRKGEIGRVGEGKIWAAAENTGEENLWVLSCSVLFSRRTNTKQHATHY